MTLALLPAATSSYEKGGDLAELMQKLNELNTKQNITTEDIEFLLKYVPTILKIRTSTDDDDIQLSILTILYAVIILHHRKIIDFFSKSSQSEAKNNGVTINPSAIFQHFKTSNKKSEASLLLRALWMQYVSLTKQKNYSFLGELLKCIKILRDWKDFDIERQISNIPHEIEIFVIVGKLLSRQAIFKSLDKALAEVDEDLKNKFEFIINHLLQLTKPNAKPPGKSDRDTKTDRPPPAKADPAILFTTQAPPIAVFNTTINAVEGRHHLHTVTNQDRPLSFGFTFRGIDTLKPFPAGKRNEIIKQILNQAVIKLGEKIAKTAKEEKIDEAGSVFTNCFCIRIDDELVIFTIQLGDCGARLIQKQLGGKHAVENLNEQVHVQSNPAEQKRIADLLNTTRRSCCPGLAASRTIGNIDIAASFGLTYEPEIFIRVLKMKDIHRFSLLTGSSGFLVDPKHAAIMNNEIIAESYNKEEEELLVLLGRLNGSKHDGTMTKIKLGDLVTLKEGEGIAIGTADGHRAFGHKIAEMIVTDLPAFVAGEFQQVEQHIKTYEETQASDATKTSAVSGATAIAPTRTRTPPPSSTVIIVAARTRSPASTSRAAPPPPLTAPTAAAAAVSTTTTTTPPPAVARPSN
jgi:hypothetical protein